jgi:PKD repeat protein
VDGGTSRFDKSGIVYHAVCSGCDAYNAADMPTSDFPTTAGAWSRVNRSNNCNNAAFKFDLSSLRAIVQSNSLQLDKPGLNNVCIPDSIVFENLSTGGKTYEWNLGDGTRIVKTDLSPVIHQYKNTGRYIVKLKAVDPGTCKVTDSTSTFVDVHIKQSFVQEDDALCAETSYKLLAGGGVSYQWLSEDGTFESSNPTPTVSPPDTLKYYVTITEATGCVNYDSVKLSVIPSVLPGFEMTLEGECKGRPVVHVSDTTENIYNAQLFFDFGDGTTADLSEITHAYDKDGLYTVKLTGVQSFCVYETTKSVPVFEMTVPNIITPASKDGMNDTFIIQYGDQEGVTPVDFDLKVSLTIYNRWGKKVYEEKDYQYDWSGDGLSAGVYYYEVTVEDHATCRSWVQVFK